MQKNDPARLEAVHATGLLDTPPEQEFDRLTRLAAKLTGAPVTFLSLVDESRDFYKSCFGFPEPIASERQLTGTTFCHYAIESQEPLAIEDTERDPTYRTVPTVKSLGVKAYLGIPLKTSAGQTIGSFCAIDFKPRRWGDTDIEVMRELAASTIREIELRAAARTLSAERGRLDTFLQNVPAGVVFAESPTGRVIVANTKAEQIIGQEVRRPQDLASYTTWTGFRSDGQPIAADEWPLARALGGEVIDAEEILFQKPNGSRTWLRVYGAPVRDDDDKIIGGVVAFYDINREQAMRSENARLYEEAQSANRAKDDFFAAVSHELRTPMTAIIGWAKLLQMEKFDSPDALEAAEAIISSARLQAKLVDDLLDVSRIATGKLTLHKERIEVNEVVEETTRASYPAAESKGVRIKVALGQSATIEADRGRIRQIVGNLLSNSMKFTPSGGLIEVSSTRENGSVCIVVRDTGRGIERDLLPHIFERFRQAKSAEQGGLGLGLTIVKHLVEQHGGEIRAESEGAGKGSTFTVQLPAAD